MHNIGFAIHKSVCLSVLPGSTCHKRTELYLASTQANGVRVAGCLLRRRIRAVTDTTSMSSRFGAVDFYAVLGVPKDAVIADITKKYRKLAMLYHPDRYPDDPDMFSRVQEAYEVLSVDDRRALFDEARETWLWNQLSLDERLVASRSARLAAEAAAEAAAQVGS
jgi:hypothetical protein